MSIHVLTIISYYCDQLVSVLIIINMHSRSRVGPWDITKTIVRQEGLVGLFRGLTSTWLREVPGYFFFFGSYNASRRILIPEDGSIDSFSS